MAVYERTYKPYTGETTPHWSRFLVLPRYTFRRVFSARLTLAFYVLCFVPPLIGMSMVYISHNLAILERIGFQFEGSEFEFIGVAFFQWFLNAQNVFFGFVLMLLVGPGLVSVDTSSNALPMYFSRPFTRAEYVAGKMTVLLALLSSITWVPLLLMFLLQAYLAGNGWLGDNLRLGVTLFVGSWIWILTLTLVAIAVSASAKRKLTASIYLFGLFLLLPAFGGIVGGAFRLWWGWLLNIWVVMQRVWSSLLGTPLPPPLDEVPAAVAWLTVFAIWGLSALVMWRRIRAYEIVK